MAAMILQELQQGLIQPITSLVAQIPVIMIDGIFSAGGADICDEKAHTNQYDAANQVSWSHGRHNMRAGFEYQRVQWNWTYRILSRGDLIFQSFPDFLLGMSGQQNGTPFRNIFLCLIWCVKSADGGPVIHGFRTTNTTSFLQDDFKVTRSLTVNVGLRYEFDGH